jgi:uncharacterized protein YndB with AHSA1/START domain
MIAPENRSVVHNTFCIERSYDAPAERVFAAFASLEAKSKWFSGPETWVAGKREFDFRVGGREVLSGGPLGGTPHTFEARYFDIIPGRRIIYAYDMYVGDRKLSVSLCTIDIKPVGKSTQLTMTEQGAYLDGVEDGSQREAGTRELLEKLGKSLG